ncbi:hypothetical protein QR680_005920 [Steinernema hermaphroditum]|uniref:Fungal lipase-type domain-containing protein n=1 Tax=Steinernema hermaphroditum TaxID=289476 RepID=A0AA39HW51_9BILA|nr:hypothetical protein QR680_005920 [Steinernema hermaphroditum]
MNRSRQLTSFRVAATKDIPPFQPVDHATLVPQSKLERQSGLVASRYQCTIKRCDHGYRYFSAMRPIVLLFAALLGSVLSVAIRRERLDLGGYDDGFARYKMFFFASAAYATDANQCMKSAYPQDAANNTVNDIIEVVCARTDSCRGFSAISHDDRAIIISFRGTTQFLQIIQEAAETVFGAEKFIGGGYVSHYFYEAFKSVWKGGLKNEVLDLIKQYPDYEVWVTGHSLGGAMASLCSATLIYLGQVSPDKVRLLTFGQPRVGDQAYADAHDALLLYSYRVVHNRDLVPHVPPEILPDNGLLDGYRHHKSEVWYDNKMRVDDSYHICNADEGNKCSDGDLITMSIMDHGHYFEDHEWITNFGDDGCPIQMVNK